MADTTVQRKAEAWIVEHELPRLYGQPFAERGMRLQWGGSFKFDAVSVDGKTIACVSTSCCYTATGRRGVGKFNKLRADALYLLHAVDVERCVMVFTDQGMLEHFAKEQRAGRFPPEKLIELRLAMLPDALAAELRVATGLASAEVSPRRDER